MDIYACRLLVLNQQTVKCEIRNPQQRVVSECHDAFNYDQHKGEISRLVQKSRENNIYATEIKQLGEDLFITLFNGDVRSQFLEYRAKARTDGFLLRIELEIEKTGLPELATLPWEFMYAPHLNGRGNFWLGTDPNLAFIRRRPRLDARAGFTLAAGEKLSVAMMIASPDDKTVVYKDFWNDIKKIEQDNSQFQLLDLVTNGTKKNIDAILAEKPHLFHLLAHGDLEIEGRGHSGFIHLVDVTGNTLTLSGPQFAELFTRYSPPVVILHVCESAAQHESDALSGLASQVVDQNVPAVLAMQYPLSNAVARQFMAKFYVCISRGDPVEKAVQEGRRAIMLGFGEDVKRDFATPILYLSTNTDWKQLEINIDLGSIELEKLLSDGTFRNKLIEALLECNSIADPTSRQQIISHLPRDIKVNIGAPNAAPRVHVSHIVQICLGYENGIQALINEIEALEGASLAVKNVKKLIGMG